MRPSLMTNPMLLVALWLTAFVQLAHAQSDAVQLRIDIERTVDYRQDITDQSKLATEPGPTTPASSRNFSTTVSVADIVAVNGEPARGTAFGRRINLISRPAPVPGQAIADVWAGGSTEWILEIQPSVAPAMDTMGRPISVGTIIIHGLAFDAAPPGAPLGGTGGNFTVLGGTGTYIGARGQATFSPVLLGRDASVAEDPGNRRNLGGGSYRVWINLIPQARPEVILTAGGPAVVHASDFSLVSAARPALAGELLTVFATGLGPTRPALDPGQLFPASPLSVVTSPLTVTVGGTPAEVLYAGGYTGTDNAYQVNFRMPSGIASGPASLKLTAAWIPGKDVRIAVR